MYEPTVTLPSGAAVLRAIVDTLDELQTQGYIVGLDADGDLVVQPAVHEDVWCVLALNMDDVRAVLEHTARVH